MLYSSLMHISQTHHSPDPNNVNVDELHETGSCPHPILQDFNCILPFLFRTSPLPSTGLLVVRSGVLSVLTHPGNGLCAVRSAECCRCFLRAPPVLTSTAFAVCLPAATHQQPLGTLPRCSHSYRTAAGCECFSAFTRCP